MAAVVQVSTGATVENVTVTGNTTEVRVEALGNFSRLIHVIGSAADENGIVVSGNDVTLEDIRVGGGTSNACIEVTGLRAKLTDIQTASSGTAAGVRFNGAADCVLNGFTSNSNENGLVILGATRIQARNVNVVSSDTEGIILDTSSYCQVQATVYNSGRHGIRIDDSSRNRVEGQVIDSGRDTNNTYDGIFVEGNSDRNRTACHVSYLGAGNQARYGINLSAGTVDGHIEASFIDAGATADFNDAGTGTVLTDDHIT